jgi:hypothetical protein
MFNMLKTVTLSTMIGLGALASLPATANAESGVYLGFGNRHDDGPNVGVYLGGGDRADYRRHDEYRYRDYDLRRSNDRGCTAGRALDKAERLGLRRARVVDVGRRTIEVSGRKFGDRVTVTFGRSPSCPILSY